MRNMRGVTGALWAAGVALVVATGAHAGEQTGVQAGAKAGVLRPGLYEGLMLALDGGGNVNGSFSQQGSCTFQISGRLSSQSVAVVRTVSEGSTPAIEGQLSAGPGSRSVTLTLPGGQQLPGCGNVLPPLIDKGLDLDLTQKGTWAHLVNVAADRTPLRKSPSDAGRAYVVRGDVLGVVSEQADLLEVEFMNAKGRVVRGWIAAKDAKAIRMP